jgi:hypothetical protein
MGVPDVSGWSSYTARHYILSHEEERGMVIVRPAHGKVSCGACGFDFGVWTRWLGCRSWYLGLMDWNTLGISILIRESCRFRVRFRKG